MFGQFFGSYLVKINRISQSQFDHIIFQHQNSSLKLGFIATAEKLLTKKQADEINELQKKMDRRFGDIALEKGYLLSEEVTYLLNLQGNPYLTFIQALMEQTHLTMTEIENCLQAYQAEYNFSSSEIEALKSGDIDRIIPIFTDLTDPLINDYIHIMIRNIIRFIDKNILLDSMKVVKEYPFSHLAYQRMEGDHNVFIGFSGDEDALLHIAEAFAKDIFDYLDEDAYDSICEFINCSNGLFASALSHNDIHIDMTPPVFESNQVLHSDGEIIIIPIKIQEKQAELIVCFNDDINVIKSIRHIVSLVTN